MFITFMINPSCQRVSSIEFQPTSQPYLVPPPPTFTELLCTRYTLANRDPEVSKTDKNPYTGGDFILVEGAGK